MTRTPAEAGNPRLAFLMSPRSSTECQVEKDIFERARFQDVLRACDAVIRDQLGWSFQGSVAFDGAIYRRAVTEAEFEPAVVALQIAMTEVWREAGSEPAAVAGASGGEYSAAFAAGALSLEDAMTVACCTGYAFARGRGVGGTIAVNFTREDAESYIRDAPTPIFLAAHYSDGAVALSGAAEAIRAVSADLSDRNVRWRPVPTEMAVHSPLMDSLEDIFAERLCHLRPHPPRVPVYSAAAGGVLHDATFDARHWWFVFRQPAYLADAARHLLSDGFDTFVEFGLQPVISSSVREAARIAGQQVQVLPASMPPARASDTWRTPDPDTAATASRGGRPPSAGTADPEFDPAAPDVRRDPYPHYHRMRARSGVHYVSGAGYWAVLRHADVTFVLKDPAIFSSGILRGFDSTLIGADPPAHTRVRQVVADAFNPRRMTALEPHIRALTDRCLDAIAGQAEFDLMGTVAMPLPVSVIAALLGMAAEDLDRLKRWSHAIVLAASGRPPADERARIMADAAEMQRFLAGHIARLEADPGDSLLGDLVGGRAGGASLSAAEAASLARLLLIAGNETTTNLIGNTVLALLRNPAELARVQQDRGLVPAAIEETLRYDPPVQTVDRITTREVTVAGIAIPAQARIGVMIGAANRDPSVFADPDTFSIARDPHGHVAFGGGPHYCVGSILSRLEARIVLEGLLERVPQLRAVQSLNDVELTPSIHLRGPRRLMLAGPQA
jgi:cytochrome P450/malonyl CoA-acyl carrier protein transacylase